MHPNKKVVNNDFNKVLNIIIKIKKEKKRKEKDLNTTNLIC